MIEILNKLRSMLCKELEEIVNRDNMTALSLDTADKLLHSIKNLDKIVISEEYDGYSRDERGEHDYSQRGRGRMNARRDSLGRYARDNSYGESHSGDYDKSYRESRLGENDSSRLASRLMKMLEENLSSDEWNEISKHMQIR